MDELNSIVNLIPEETKKDIYDDAIKLTMVETGKTIALLPRVIRNAFSKVEMWCLNREFEVEKFKLELQKELERKKIENIVEADPAIFIPSAQAISYNWHKEEIKNLYMNLMVSDMDKELKEYVHPSFSELIKQMDSIDVKVFTQIYSRLTNAIPVCSLNKKSSSEIGGICILEYLLSDGFYNISSEEKIIKSLNNLERLKLIDITMTESFTNEANYIPIVNGNCIKKYMEEYGEKLDIDKGVIKCTKYGEDFYNVCCK